MYSVLDRGSAGGIESAETLNVDPSRIPSAMTMHPSVKMPLDGTTCVMSSWTMSSGSSSQTVFSLIWLSIPRACTRPWAPLTFVTDRSYGMCHLEHTSMLGTVG